MATATPLPHDLDLSARRDALLVQIGHPLPEHLPGHFPGQLYDCAACESACFCTADSTPCVYCALLEEATS